MRELDGKVALVTGGNSGIGRATVLAFARKGAKVVIASRRIKESEETVRLVQEANGEAIFIKTDISEAAEVEALVSKAVKIYGRLDYAFNNAGIEGKGSPIIELTEDVWDKIISSNLKGVWLSMKYEILQMLKQGSGAIVNNGSIYALVGVPNFAVYSASKHGVLGLTKSAAIEYATTGIRINAVCPGGIKTPMMDRLFKVELETQLVRENPTEQMDLLKDSEARFAKEHPLGRLGTSEEVAEAVIWLCSDAASFITGHSLAIDGGYTIC